MNYSRVKKLQQALSVQALLIEDPIDLYYLLGLDLSLGTLVVTAQEFTLFVDGRYLEIAKKTCHVMPLETLMECLQSFSSLGFDSAKTSVERLNQIEKALGKKLEQVPHITKYLRLIKDEDEIVKIKKSCQIAARYMQKLQSELKVGVQENEIALCLKKMALDDGLDKLSFEPIVAFGPHAAMPHYKTGEQKLEKGQCALLDLGTMFQGYCSDMTRTFFADMRLYNLVKEAKEEAANLAKVGVKIGALDEAVRRVFAREGMLSHYLHSLGHGLGLEIHEAPRIKAGGIDSELILQENMVITIEPGLYLEGVGGVRLEDTYLITNRGAIPLTAIPNSD